MSRIAWSRLPLVSALLASSVAADQLDVGLDAPSLSITKWIRGDAVDLASAKGKNVIVVEFWATWCGPCIASMPHLSELQKKHADKGLIIIGVTKPDPNNALEKVEQFTKDNAEKQAYTVAFDGDGATFEAYMRAADQNGIPTAFIVDRDGKIAWIGHPMNMDAPLEQVLAGTHDIGLFKLNKVLADRVRDKRRTQDWEAVVRTLDAMAALDPQNPGPWRDRIQPLVGPLAAPDKALAAAERALTLSADSADELSMLASSIRYSADAPGLRDVALKAARRSLELRPADVNTRLTLIDLLVLSGKTEEALATAKQAYDAIAATDPAQLTGLIRTLTQPSFDGKGVALAITAAEKAVESGWENATTLTLIGFSLRSVKDNDAAVKLALKAARRAVELKPEEARGWVNLVDTLVAANDVDGVLAVIEQKQDVLLKQDPTVLAAVARSLSAPALGGRGAAFALRAVNAGLEARPDDLGLLETRFRVQALGLKDKSAAVNTGELLLEKASQNPAMLNTFAWALLTEDGLKGGYNALALSAASKCHEVSGGQNWAYLDTLALAKFESGAVDEAVALERKSIELALKAGVSDISELTAALERFNAAAGKPGGQSNPK